MLLIMSPAVRQKKPPPFDAFVRSVTLLREQIPDASKYPFSIPSVRHLDSLELNPQVTFFVGENGSGKSTLIEAIAVAAGFNAEGGSRHFNFATRRSESELHQHLRLVRGVRRPKTGYFLRAESFFNVSTEVEKIPEALASHGGVLHERSHGEAFLALVENRFWANGLYILDEPEAALSPQRQLSLLKLMHELAEKKACQFLIATHSPILLAYPGATIYALMDEGLTQVGYKETEHYALTRDFLLSPERYLARLFVGEDASAEDAE
jgi:predicted ATPase